MPNHLERLNPQQQNGTHERRNPRQRKNHARTKKNETES